MWAHGQGPLYSVNDLNIADEGIGTFGNYFKIYLSYQQTNMSFQALAEQEFSKFLQLKIFQEMPKV